MNASEIKTAVGFINTLPLEERMELANITFEQLGTETFGDRLRFAFEKGDLATIIAETDAEYERGEALDRFC